MHYSLGQSRKCSWSVNGDVAMENYDEDEAEDEDDDGMEEVS